MPVSKPSLGVIVRSLKSATTKQVHELGGHADRLWQPNYYERVVRNEQELNRIRQYIISNPENWLLDYENPNREDDEQYRRVWGWLESSGLSAQHAARLRPT